MSIKNPNAQNFAVLAPLAHKTDWNNNAPLWGGLTFEHLFFHENDGSSSNGWRSYTGIVNLPKRALLFDIVAYAEVVWDDTGTVSMNVGDHNTAGTALDADGYFTGVNLKATDLTAEQTIRLSGNLATAGGEGGAYTNVGTNTHLTDLYYPDGGQIRVTIAAQNGDGDAGKTHLFVVYGVDAFMHQVRGTTS